jgi:hypothetical protein
MTAGSASLVFNNNQLGQQVAGLPVASSNNQLAQQNTNLKLVQLGDMAPKERAGAAGLALHIGCVDRRGLDERGDPVGCFGSGVG